MGKIIINEGVAPVAPIGTGKHTVYVDSADSKIKVKNEADEVSVVASEAVVDSKISTAEIESATNTEIVEGTVTDKYISPAGLKTGFNGGDYDIEIPLNFYQNPDVSSRIVIGAAVSGITVEKVGQDYCQFYSDSYGNNYLNTCLPRKPLSGSNERSELTWGDVEKIELECYYASGNITFIGFSNQLVTPYYNTDDTTDKVMIEKYTSDTYRLNTSDNTTHSNGTGYTVTDGDQMNKIKIIVTPGVSAEFYLNDVLKETKTTNIPLSTSTNMLRFGLGCLNTSTYIVLQQARVRIKYT